jgi:paraquat-inducible protein A
MRGPTEEGAIPEMTDDAHQGQVACPDCDLMMDAPADDARLTCTRCHKVIARPLRNTRILLVGLSVISLGLVAAVCFFPFLSLKKIGLGNSASLFDAIFVFTGEQTLLAITVAALILVIPAVRTGLLLFALLPSLAGAAAGRTAFAVSEALRPWSMVEVFALGCAVSLIKLSSEASVGLGPAFWMFLALVAVTLLQERLLCSWSIWKSLDPKAA